MRDKINLVSPNGTGIITEYIDCLPEKASLEKMLNSGFKLIVNDKKLTKAEAVKYISAERKT